MSCNTREENAADLAADAAAMQIFTIDQCYNCANWRTVHVRAPNLDLAVDLANGADTTFHDDELGDDPPPNEGEAGVLQCTEWESDGGGGECGPTFTVGVARGWHDGTSEAPADDALVVPNDVRQFYVEWTRQAGVRDELYQALKLVLPYALSRVEDIVEEAEQEKAEGREGTKWDQALVENAHTIYQRAAAALRRAEEEADCLEMWRCGRTWAGTSARASLARTARSTTTGRAATGRTCASEASNSTSRARRPPQPSRRPFAWHTHTCARSRTTL